MWLARDPAVTKIFSPLMTYSSPSRLAVVDTAAESDPKPGSVIAIAAHTLPRRCELLVGGHPGNGGIAEALMGHRQQQRDVAPADLHRVEHRGHVAAVVVLLLGLLAVAERFGAGECERVGLRDAFEQVGQRVELDRVGVLGRSYLREIGRSISAAPWCALSMTACSLRGISRLIAMTGLSFG